MAETSVSVSFPRRFIIRVREVILVCGFFQVLTLPNLLSSLRRQEGAPPDPGTAPSMGCWASKKYTMEKWGSGPKTLEIRDMFPMSGQNGR